MDMNILPPQLSITPNVKIRLKVLAGVLDELTKICGVTLTETIKKGIVERDIIDRITLDFCSAPKKSRGKIIFEIDWERFEFVAKIDEGKVIYSNIDMSKNLSKQLDQRLYDAILVYVNRIKAKYHITSIETHYDYRDKYKITDEIYETTMKHLGHVFGENMEDVPDTEFKNEITAAFQGLDRILNVKFKI